MKLNIGCGRDIKKGYINLDLSSDFGADVVCDLNKGKLPFGDDVFDEVICFNTLEHVKDWISIIDEIYRVSNNGAIIKIQVPFYHCQNAFYPEHINFFTSASFDIFIFDKSNPQKKGFKAVFKLINKIPNKYILSISRFIPELTQQIYFEFKVIKNV